MANSINVGDVVRLKSGGPPMTVEKIAEYIGGVKANCVWFEGAKRQDALFALAVLEVDSGPTIA